MGKPRDPDYDNLKALGSKWIEQCTACLSVRKLLKQVDAKTYPYDELAEVHVKGLSETEIDCPQCHGKGWILTPKAMALVKLLQLVHPIPEEEKEIPF